jgi:predicted lipoprotein with Yx(FWY)xxD motif
MTRSLPALNPARGRSRHAAAAWMSALVLGAGLWLSGCAAMSPEPAKTADGVLVGGNGMSLYTFDRDAAGSGKSVCNGPCAQNWPPLAAPADARPSGEWSVITRDDGARHWAYKGKPLYFWVRDQKAGDRTGDGFNNAWRLARP